MQLHHQAEARRVLRAETIENYINKNRETCSSLLEGVFMGRWTFGDYAQGKQNMSTLGVRKEEGNLIRFPCINTSIQ